MLKQLYFVRHGETEWNAIRRMQGQWNSNLNELGLSQADTNGQLLKQLGIDVIYASPLDRTRQTAEIINTYLNLHITYDERIMEWDCGDWSGYLYAEIRDRWPEEWQALEADRFHYRGPNCENYPDMFARARPFLADILASDADRIAIVSHGMIGKVMISSLLDFDKQQTLLMHQPNQVVFRISINQADTEIHHFVGGKGPYAGIFEPG